MDPIPTPPNPFAADGGAFAFPTLAEAFLAPGDWAIYVLVTRAPVLAEFFGVGHADYGGTFAVLLAGILWLLFVLTSIAATSAVRQFDRVVTARILYGVSELRRRVRMAIVLARYRRNQRVARAEPTFGDEETGITVRVVDP
jgi:hypothetical protein